jgi:hypothetical protein
MDEESSIKGLDQTLTNLGIATRPVRTVDVSEEPFRIGDPKLNTSHFLKDLGNGKPPDYDNAALLRRVDRFEQRIEEQADAIFAHVPEPTLGKLKIPEHTRGRKELAGTLGRLTDALNKLEAVLYKKKHDMQYRQDVPDSNRTVLHRYKVQGPEYYSTQDLYSLEMFSSMAEMMRENLSGKENGNGNGKRAKVTVQVESPTGLDITNKQETDAEPAQFKLKFSKPYRFVNALGVQEDSEESLEIALFPLEYAPYQMLEPGSLKEQKVLASAKNATTNQLRTLMESEYGHKDAALVGEKVHNFSEQVRGLGSDVPHVTLRYKRGAHEFTMRGDLVNKDGRMGFQLSYPQFGTDVFVPMYDKSVTRKVEDGLHHTDATKLYNIGMAIASVRN